MEQVAVHHFRAAPSWRRIAIAAGAVAALELVLLVVAGIGLLAKPVQRSVRMAAQETAGGHATHARPAGGRAAAASAATAARRRAAGERPAAAPALVGAGAPHLPRAHTAVLVLNGIGTPGAAGRAADRVRAKGYRVDGVTNAPHMVYTRTMILYRPGFRAEGARLGKDLSVRLVGPLDGMRPSDLGKAQLVVIVGR